MMIWKGMLLGSFVGSLMGGTLGSLLGAVLGYQVEMRFFRQKPSVRRAENPYAAEYRVLGAAESWSNERLKQRYRELAKRYHPDVMRAEGKSETDVALATERMERINAAWAAIKEQRRI